MNNAGFLSIENVRENQLNNLSKQIDELREENDRLEDFNEELMEERNRLHSIIKEVREYIEKHIAIFKGGDMLVDMNIDELLEKLDKGEQNGK